MDDTNQTELTPEQIALHDKAASRQARRDELVERFKTDAKCGDPARERHARDMLTILDVD